MAAEKNRAKSEPVSSSLASELVPLARDDGFGLPVFVVTKFLYESAMTRGVIIVEQTGSPVRCHNRWNRVRRTLIGLGLNRIGRVAWLPNTPESRGMIASVGHIVRVAIDVTPLARCRFNALAGYARKPELVLLAEQLWTVERTFRTGRCDPGS